MRMPPRRVLPLSLGHRALTLAWLACVYFATPAVTEEAKAAEPSASSLSRLAAEVRKIPASEPNLVAIAPVVVDGTGLSKGASTALHEELVQLVGSAVSFARLRPKEPLSLAEGSRAARRAGLTLVHLAPTLRGGTLELRVSIVKWPRSFWQRTLVPQGTTTDHQVLEVPADASIRRHLPKPPGLLSSRLTFKSPISAPLALACGDLNGDGGQELVVVGRRSVHVGRFVGDKFVSEATRTWDELSPVSGAPLRTPLGAVQITDKGALVGISDRAHLVLLNSSLSLTGHAGRAYPESDGLCRTFETTGISAQSTVCPKLVSPPHSAPARNAPRDAPLGEGPALSHASRGQATEENGTVTKWEARLAEAGEPLELAGTFSGRETLRLKLGDVGSSVALADLEGDGTLDLITSSATLIAKEDSIRVHSLTFEGAIERAVVNAKQVHALAVCPFSGENPLVVVAAVDEHLLVLR